ncbi:MAG: wax ester/triacylglycerol synthase family O-acyltransferase [Mycobacterium sp.]
MKRLNGMDAMLLYSETPNLHTHTLKVAVIDATDYDGDFSFEVFRQTIQRRLHLLDPLRYRLVDIPWKLHHPMWMEDCEVDLDYHLRRVQIPSPGGRRELDQVIGEIASTPLDRDRPLWEFHFAEGMADNRFALIGKVHHTLADGVASANLLARLMDLTGSEQEERDGYTTREPPSPRELLRTAGRDHVQNIAALPGLIRDGVRGFARVRRRSKERGDQPEMAKMFKFPPTFVNHVVSPVRTFATASLALNEVKETAKHLGVTFNDIVLSMAAGGLRELLLRYDGRADRPIMASVPVATDKSVDRITGNEISGLPVSLPVHIDDPLERVRLTAMAASRAKEDNELLGPKLHGRLMEYLPPAFAPALFRWQAKRTAHSAIMNVAVSNVPGPRERGHIGGAPVNEIYSIGILSAGSAFNMTVWSYVDQVDISILSDDLTFNDVHEATDAMIHGLAEIRRAAGLPAELSTVDTAMAPTKPVN